MDPRTPDERRRDQQRRLDTQCIFLGWFENTREEKERTRKRWVYRQCWSSSAQDYHPYCKNHALDRFQPRYPDPNETPPKDRKKSTGRRAGGGSPGSLGAFGRPKKKDDRDEGGNGSAPSPSPPPQPQR